MDVLRLNKNAKKNRTITLDSPVLYLLPKHTAHFKKNVHSIGS